MSEATDAQLKALPGFEGVDKDDRLVIAAGRKRLRLPLLRLRDARLTAIKGRPLGGPPRVVIAPYLSENARKRIEEASWSWVAGGSAHIEADGILIHIERPPAERSRERLSLVIPPQGERIVRYLLDHHPRTPRFSELARLTRLDKGYASRILRRLAETGLVAYERNRPIDVPYPAELFELWQTVPPRLTESRWFVSERGGPRGLAARVREQAGTGQVAFTGTFAAGLLVPRIDAERVECFVNDLQTARRIVERFDAESVDRGYNLVFLVHRDPGILSIGVSQADDLPLVSVSQIYRDALQRGRGREREAANELRRELLRW